MTSEQDQNFLPVISNSEALQKEHYERIAADYDAHYNDFYSQTYMRRFAFEPMFEGIELNGQNTLEAMCGGGQATPFLLSKGARVTGLDISPQQTQNFKRRHQKADVMCGSILNSGFADESFDTVAVIGGIHHMPPYCDESIHEIRRILKPGGHFCFMEPHNESYAERIRQEWYKRDPLFAKNEAAISMTELHESFKDYFNFKHEYYLGNFGYLFVLNSMVFRVPPKLKPVYSPAIIWMEAIFNRILGKRFSCFVLAQWEKK